MRMLLKSYKPNDIFWLICLGFKDCPHPCLLHVFPGGLAEQLVGLRRELQSSAQRHAELQEQIIARSIIIIIIMILVTIFIIIIIISSSSSSSSSCGIIARWTSFASPSPAPPSPGCPLWYIVLYHTVGILCHIIVDHGIVYYIMSWYSIVHYICMYSA